MVTVNVDVTREQNICIGRVGENNHVQVVFDVSSWMAEYPSATIGLFCCLPDQCDTYPVANTEHDGNTFTWTVGSADVSYPGRGKCEIVCIDNGTVAKSMIFGTLILEALGGCDHAPQPWEYWQIKFIELKGDAEQAVADAQAASSSAYSDAASAHDDAAAAAGSAAAAAASETNAAESKDAAAGSATAAAGSASDAQASATAAAGSATDAAGSATAAAGSATAAASSETNAAGSATAAEESAQDSEAYAVGKRAGVDVDSTDETYHNNAKYYNEQAQTAKTTAQEAAASAAAAYGTDLLAADYDTETGATAGNYYIYSGDLYLCTADTTGAWDSTKFAKVTVGGQLGELKSAIDNVKGTVDSNLFSVISTINPYSGYDGTGKRINSDGIIVSDSGFNTYRYTLSDVSVLKITSDDKFIFQNASTRPASAPNNYLVGPVYGTYDGIIQVPNGATNLYISTPATGGTASVSTVANVIDKLTDDVGKTTAYGIEWESGFINASGAEASNAGYMRTNYIPINAISCPVYYKLKVTSSVGYVALYDEGHNFIECIAGTTTSVTEVSGMVVPNAKNIKYVRFSSNISNGYAPTVLFISNGQYAITERSVKQSNLGPDILTLADGCNPIDYNGLYEGKYITGTGAMGSSTSVWATDYIPLEEETTYYQQNVMNTYYAFYDSTKAFISGYSTLGDLDGSFTTPAGTAYGRFTLATSAFNYKNAWINSKNEMPSVYQLALNKSIKVYAGSGTDVSNPCDYSGEEITTFVKGICIGDSLTAGAFNTTAPTAGNQVYDKNSYPRSLERLTGIQITNAGHSGYTSAEWYTAYSSEDYSGHDFAIIQLGVNDQIRYGAFGDTSKTAFENIFAMMKTQNPKIKIFVANIIPALSYQAQGYITFSNALLAWVEAKHLNDPDIIPLDIQQYGHTDDSQAFNCGHLSAFGYNQLARDYKAYISWYMAQNKMEFRQVQFIGTEYSYSD